MKVFKSIAAVLAGLIVPFILAMITDMILEKSGVFPSVEHQKEHGFNILWMNLLALAYRFGFTVLGGYVTAKWAPSNPMRHVTILATIGTVLALVSNIAVANIPETANVLPLWFMVVLVIMVIPGVWLGGKLAVGNGKGRK